MAWLQLKFTTTKTLAPAFDDLLTALGAGAVLMEDAADQPLLEPPPGATPLWDAVVVVGLFTADSDMDAIVEFLGEQLGEAMPSAKVELLEDKDWERAWMDNYHPMQFGDRLWVCPSWREPPEPNAVNLLLDPGLAFGTGTHATTALCLQWLDGLDLAGKTVIDYGCGSGILAIAALLLGAREAWCVDNDPQALISTRNNAEHNGVADRVHVCLPEDFPAEITADVVVANILAGPLVELAPVLSARCRPGGVLALSGLIRPQVDDVREAYDPTFDMDGLAIRDEDWCRLSGTRRANP